MLFRVGETREVPVERFEWHHSFIDCTRHLIDVLGKGGEPLLDGATGKAVLQFSLAAHLSALEGREVRPDQVKPRVVLISPPRQTRQASAAKGPPQVFKPNEQLAVHSCSANTVA